MKGENYQEKLEFLWKLMGKCLVVIQLITQKGHAVAFAQGILLKPVVSIFQTMIKGYLPLKSNDTSEAMRNRLKQLQEFFSY